MVKKLKTKVKKWQRIHWDSTNLWAMYICWESSPCKGTKISHTFTSSSSFCSACKFLKCCHSLTKSFQLLISWCRYGCLSKYVHSCNWTESHRVKLSLIKASVVTSKVSLGHLSLCDLLILLQQSLPVFLSSLNSKQLTNQLFCYGSVMHHWTVGVKSPSVAQNDLNIFCIKNKILQWFRHLVETIS